MNELLRLEQVNTEQIYSKKEIKNTLRKELGNTINMAKCLKLLANWLAEPAKYLSKQTRKNELANRLVIDSAELTGEDLIMELLLTILPFNGQQQIQAVVSNIAPLLGFKKLTDSLVTASEIIVVLCESDLYDVYPAKFSNQEGITVQSNIQLSKELQIYISKTMYLPPMLCKPNKVINNFNAGFLSIKEPVLLGKVRHEKEICLDVINIQNSIELSLDTNMLEWEEESKKELDTLEKQKAFQSKLDTAIEIYENILANQNSMYLPHKYDSRGRIYCAGYHTTYQGNEYAKALVNIKHKEIVKLPTRN